MLLCQLLRNDAEEIDNQFCVSKNGDLVLGSGGIPTTDFITEDLDTARATTTEYSGEIDPEERVVN